MNKTVITFIIIDSCTTLHQINEIRTKMRVASKVIRNPQTVRQALANYPEWGSAPEPGLLYGAPEREARAAVARRRWDHNHIIYAPASPHPRPRLAWRLHPLATRLSIRCDDAHGVGWPVARSPLDQIPIFHYLSAKLP